MRGLSFPDCFAFSADAFWKAGGISLPCQIIWTGCTCLASLPACLLLSFTQHSLWHHVGRVVVRSSGSFDVTTANAKVQGISYRSCTALHRAGGCGSRKGAAAFPSVP